MNTIIDTDHWLQCERCERTIAPDEPKLIWGTEDNVEHENEIKPYCISCATKMFAPAKQ